jgi:transposase-like protein
MAKIIPITEHFQHFLAEMKESFWGGACMDRRSSVATVVRAAVGAATRSLFWLGAVRTAAGATASYRNGYYERDFVTRFGTIRLRIARTPERSFLPCGLKRFQRRAEEVSLLIREAFLRGISTRHVGRVVATLTGEMVSAQTVSKLTRDLDEAVRQFQVSPGEAERRLCLLISGWSEPAGAASSGTQAGTDAGGLWGAAGRHSPFAGLPAQPGRKSGGLGGLLQDLYRRGLEGKRLALIVTDGCAGLAAAIPTVYPRARHQRCWVHKMRNILEKVRKSDYEEVKAGAQAIYLAESRGQAVAAFRSFRDRWRREYGSVVRRLERDLPELLAFFAFPRHLWRKLRTTNVIERCFVEVRRRTRPMVCFVNVESVDRSTYSIFQRFNLEWQTRTLNLFTQAA